MDLIIVESPTKAKTISKFLGKNYMVKSSYGHIRDLPQKKLGIDIEHDFEPTYAIMPKAKKTVSELKKIAKKADNIILATDEDREGEAIAWHLIKALELNNEKVISRIVFHEITKRAIDEALKNPRQINSDLVDAQQTRRILDRLVGYKLSPLLWKKIAKGLSAGRVQSAAVRLIVDKEKEIHNFKSEEYWTLTALLSRQRGDKEEFESLLAKIDDKAIPKIGIKTEQEIKDIINNLTGTKYKITEINKKETRKNPLPPFITSTLQQEAAKKLGFSAKQTMMLAQQLYEGIEIGAKGSIGLITYMRTDSVNLSTEAIEQTRQYIASQIGPQYLSETIQRYKTKSKNAQEAHEAIRPSDITNSPNNIKSYLDPKQLKLYTLIWQRTMACQMKPAILDTTTISITAIGADKKKYTFKTSGSIIKFEGFLKIYPAKISENILPNLQNDEEVNLIKLIPDQHFTQPPARYNEASLIKTLEEYGIGRPSTYAPILSTIQNRRYVEKNEDRRFQPTEIGALVNQFIMEHFPEIIDLQFTANMEESLDDIANGEKEMLPIIKNFYQPFAKNLIAKEEEIKKMVQTTDKICPKCGKNLVIKFSKNGKFIACPGFPECKYIESTRAPQKSTGIQCPACQKGEIVEKTTRKGKLFYACNQYPQCDYALWLKPVNQNCPKCGSLMVETKKEEIKCPKCDK